MSGPTKGCGQNTATASDIKLTPQSSSSYFHHGDTYTFGQEGPLRTAKS